MDDQGVVLEYISIFFSFFFIHGTFLIVTFHIPFVIKVFHQGVVLDLVIKHFISSISHFVTHSHML